jgi:N6-L-threonylcarbamoyladenine synthase
MARYVLGIDTSNYTTSAAVIDDSFNTVKDIRTPLKVRKGERGLRQQEALFQHVYNLPELIKEALSDIDSKDISAVSVSCTPRPREDSYMPVFIAGVSVARSVAAALDRPCFEFSHQEGHIAAASKDIIPGYAFHMSGGTCELLECSSDGSLRIAGGSRDISFGQVLDRVGVAMGYAFPSGPEIDANAVYYSKTIGTEDHVPVLTDVKVHGRYFNLSGLETQLQRKISADSGDKLRLSYELLCIISDTIDKTCRGLDNVLLIGGVSESTFIREKLQGNNGLVFSEKNMGSDNAVGTARLGGRKVWL